MNEAYKTLLNIANTPDHVFARLIADIDYITVDVKRSEMKLIVDCLKLAVASKPTISQSLEGMVSNE